MMDSTLHYSDCLEVLRTFPDACVDLIYLDPPFNFQPGLQRVLRTAEGWRGECLDHGL